MLRYQNKLESIFASEIQQDEDDEMGFDESEEEDIEQSSIEDSMRLSNIDMGLLMGEYK